jgi:hypothetical protein
MAEIEAKRVQSSDEGGAFRPRNANPMSPNIFMTSFSDVP